ncbi:metal ABC transporter ATP-binding protein [Amnibacterium flavum]|uniref:metal ABC transporter ATP-binding protein n=1 Tax=Amnibacterium flavum TaxID=2173173 RepID=UPI001F0CCF1F|nr:metal ABC transporter ATP-binding protein [Amnibacterium flavum]
MPASPTPASRADDGPLVSLVGAGITLGGRALWTGLDLDVRPGEFVAVLGPNGAGKSSLLRVLLGRLALSSGTASVLDAAPGRAGDRIGYVPQQQLFDRGSPLRARDLVGLGFDGTRLGLPLARRRRDLAIDEALDLVGAGGYSRRPVGSLSGGEQQRLRIAQALVSSPRLLLADEPLLSLDLGHQRAVLDAIDAYRRSADAGVVLVTHDINPLLRMVDRVLYLAPGGHRVGATGEVLTGDVLTELYGVHVDVVDIHGRLVVVASDEELHDEDEGAFPR